MHVRVVLHNKLGIIIGPPSQYVKMICVKLSILFHCDSYFCRYAMCMGYYFCNYSPPWDDFVHRASVIFFTLGSFFIIFVF